jgi:hypothetical protein
VIPHVVTPAMVRTDRLTTPSSRVSNDELDNNSPASSDMAELESVKKERVTWRPDR